MREMAREEGGRRSAAVLLMAVFMTSETKETLDGRVHGRQANSRAMMAAIARGRKTDTQTTPRERSRRL